MASLEDIRRRIGSVKNTQKVTRAMKLVAASKLRRAQEAVTQSRPYLQELRRFVETVVADAKQSDSETVWSSLMASPDAKNDANGSFVNESVDSEKTLYLAFTSDRGLCGGFNASVLKRADVLIDLKARVAAKTMGDACDTQIGTVGRKGRDYYNYRNVPLAQEFAGVATKTARDDAKHICKAVTAAFNAQTYTRVVLVYNAFKSAMRQELTEVQLLPVVVGEAETNADTSSSDYGLLYEPGPEQILNSVLPTYVEALVYQVCLESIASEFGARMTAMENATNNASDVVSSLTLEYNKARQAAITKELLEIVAGAEAL